MGVNSLTDVKIAKAHSSQKREILTINQQTFENHRKRLPTRFYEDGSQSREKLISAALSGESDKHFILSAIHGNECAGYVHCFVEAVQTGLKSHDVSGLVVDLSLSDRFRGQGIGRALLAAGEVECKRLGATRIGANVWQGNEHSYYLFGAAGFEVEMFEFGKRLAPELLTAAPTTTKNASSTWRYAVIWGLFILVLTVLANILGRNISQLLIP